jgi:hypothetical protein
MKFSLISLAFGAVLLGTLRCIAETSATNAPPEPPPIEWPRVVVLGDVTNTIYQPQLESWDNVTLKARSAVSIQSNGAPQAAFGTIDLTARTQVDRAERQVLLNNLQVSAATFPSEPAQASARLAMFNSMISNEVRSISLDRIEASLAIAETRQKGRAQPLKNDPPVIIFSRTAALVITIEGPPVYRRVQNTQLQRVLNTRAFLLRDDTGKHYLHFFDGYLEAPKLDGPWTVSANLPVDVAQAERQAIEAKQVDMLVGQENPDTKQKPSLKSTPLPVLYVVTVPTELVVTTGELKWAAVPSTELTYLANTTSHVFRQLDEQKTYLLISGRWFRSSSFDGPWEFVPATNLPKDFANIPDDSPQENVKASVPGTVQAREALIENSIPQTVKVDRKQAKMSPPPTYDGAPQLKPIEGTPLTYAVNCAMPVIQADSRNWYACQNGVWFAGTSAHGPWVAAPAVPTVIYSIPPASPLHYVTYVTIDRYDTNSIWASTTPGYGGTVVSTDGTVVYGTGYVYPAYVGETIYVSYPVTYGYACNPCWTPWAGWAFGFAAGWATEAGWYWWCACPPAPYWGPYAWWCYGARYNAYGGVTAWGPYGWAGTSGYVYHRDGPWTGVTRSAAGYDAWTGNEWASQYGRAYNSTTGTRAIGQRGAIENVFTGNYATGGRAAFYNENTGVVGAGRQVTVGNEASGRSVTAGSGTAYNPATGRAVQVSGVRGEEGGAINVNNHVVAGRDGNYYRPDGNGGWERINTPVTPTPTGRPAVTPQQNVANQQQDWSHWQPSAAEQQYAQALQNELQSRDWGAARQESFQVNRPAFSGGGGGRRR